MLDSRKNRILKAIIDEYVSNYDPVGSSTLVEKYHLNYSSATIRNDMADLEKMEYLEKPHTSAGRIPSKRAFQYYIDELIQKEEIDTQETNYIESKLETRVYDIEQLIKIITEVLSDVTNYTSLAIEPQITIQNIEEIKFVPLSLKLLMVIIITNTGNIKQTVIKFNEDITKNQIELLDMIFNRNLKGEPISNMRKSIEKNILSQEEYSIKVIKPVIEQINKVLSQESSIYVKGFNNLLSTTEFKDLNIVKDFIDILDSKELIIDLLNSDLGKKVNVIIGGDSINEKLDNFSIITYKYHLGNKPIGTIGIIAPIRMKYAKVITVMNYIDKNINEQFNKGLL